MQPCHATLRRGPGGAPRGERVGAGLVPSRGLRRRRRGDASPPPPPHAPGLRGSSGHTEAAFGSSDTLKWCRVSAVSVGGNTTNLEFTAGIEMHSLERFRGTAGVCVPVQWLELGGLVAYRCFWNCMLPPCLSGVAFALPGADSFRRKAILLAKTTAVYLIHFPFY